MAIQNNSSEKGKNVLVIGLGYVGLTFAIHCCDKEYNVYGIEINETILSSLNSNKAHFLEPGIDDLISKYKDKSFFCLSSVPENIEFDYIIISVGTPYDKKNSYVDLKSMEAALSSTSNVISDRTLVVLRSTVSVSTSRNFVYEKLKTFGVTQPKLAFCPERTVEGKALIELNTLPQIIGALDDSSMEMAEKFFLNLSDSIIKVASLEAAELVKLLNNTYRDSVFAIANSFNNIAQAFGIDGNELIQKSNLDYPRSSIPSPGFVAGPCLEKDAYILIDNLKDVDSKNLISSMRKMNENLELRIAKTICSLYKKRNCNKPILLSGMAFKGVPATNDLRGSSSNNILEYLIAQGLEGHLHDFENPASILKEFYNTHSIDSDDFQSDKLLDYEFILLLNNHPKYKEKDSYEIILNLKKSNPNIFIFDAWDSIGGISAELNGSYKNLGNIFL
jgi:UDP-N-acetyl-D-mannosaminuronic acid dehydrogenase